MKYDIFENKRFVATVESEKGWRKVVNGLNIAMDVVDCDYQEITVQLRDKQKTVVYHQPHTRVP